MKVPLLLTATYQWEPDTDSFSAILGKFYVSKVQLEEGLKFIGEGNGVEQREARRRKVFSDLIAASRK
jgi:hypothetical protein